MVDPTFSGSYSVVAKRSPRQVGLTRILNVTGTVTGDTGAVACQVAYDRTNNKIQLYTSNGASPARLKGDDRERLRCSNRRAPHVWEGR